MYSRLFTTRRLTLYSANPVRFFYSNNSLKFNNFGPPFFDLESNIIYDFAQRHPRFFLAALSIVTVSFGIYTNMKKEGSIEIERKSDFRNDTKLSKLR